MDILRLGYIHIRVNDLAAALAHYTDVVGLEQTAGGDQTCLKAWDEWDHHSIVLEAGEGGLVKMGWKAASPDALSAIEKRAEAFGVNVSRMEKGENVAVGDGFRCETPSGHVAEFYAEIEVLGTETGTINPDPWPREGLRGVGVPRLSHIALNSADVAAAERFFLEVGGLHCCERVVPSLDAPEPLVTFLSCGEQPHDIAIQGGEPGKFHHVAFQVDTWYDVLRAGDIFSMTDTPVDVGPTRHGATRGQTLYFFDPTGNRNEVFSGGYRSGPDQPTITWTLEQIERSVFYIDRRLPENFRTVVT